MKLKLRQITLILWMLVFSVQAQEALKKDTCYTVNSAYKKYSKNYQQIVIVKPQLFSNLTEMYNLVYKEIGTRKLHLDAYLNTEKKHAPAIVLIHGGGWKSGDKSLMTPMAQNLAARAYACFALEYRLSGEAVYPAAIHDVIHAIQFIKANAETFNIDTTRIALLGCSSGGQMAALIGTSWNKNVFEAPDLKSIQSFSVQAVIDLDGILAFKHPDSQEGEAASQWLGGSFQENPDIWIQASALTHTDKNTPPILFIGSQFPRFLAGKEGMIKILDQHNIYHQTIVLSESPHSFWLFHPWFEPVINDITAFLNITLKDNIKSKKI